MAAERDLAVSPDESLPTRQVFAKLGGCVSADLDSHIRESEWWDRIPILSFKDDRIGILSHHSPSPFASAT
jgi:hypothetical protein